jgi:ribose 5-phosphate isomerase A
MKPNSSSADPEARFKEAAAARAVQFVRSGMKVGLGTGSTAIFATHRIAELLKTGELNGIVAVATSKATAEEAVRLGIPLLPDDLPEDLDVTIDGADEVDPEMNLIKGGGGALLREKIVAQVSQREIIVVDETKPSPRLGTRWPVPVEVIPFGWRSQARYLESLGAKYTVRKERRGTPFVTDSGNMILDCHFGPIAEARQLAAALDSRAGIVAHGLFIDLATDLIVAGASGVQYRRRQALSDAAETLQQKKETLTGRTPRPAGKR